MGARETPIAPCTARRRTCLSSSSAPGSVTRAPVRAKQNNKILGLPFVAVEEESNIHNKPTHQAHPAQFIASNRWRRSGADHAATAAAAAAADASIGIAAADEMAVARLRLVSPVLLLEIDEEGDGKLGNLLLDLGRPAMMASCVIKGIFVDTMFVELPPGVG